MKIHALALARRSTVMCRSRSAAGGFTLLEVLVAILVLSFGVLGVVGLQAAALQANREARYQSTAVAMARELGDLMRGNKDVAIAAGNPYLGSWTSTSTLTAPSCSPCANATAVAQANMADWLTRVQDALPGVRVEVCFDAGAYGGTSANVPTWGCTNTGGLAVVKMGWTRQSTNRNDADPEQAVRPAVVVPLIAGSAT